MPINLQLLTESLSEEDQESIFRIEGFDLAPLAPRYPLPQSPFDFLQNPPTPPPSPHRRTRKHLESDLLTDLNECAKSFKTFMTVRNLGRKKDDLLQGLIRSMGKLARFCKRADNSDFDTVFRVLVSDHKYLEKAKKGTTQRVSYERVRATDASRGQYFGLFLRYQSLKPTVAERNQFYEFLAGLVPKRQFTKETQRRVFASVDVRKFYYYVLEFLSGDSDALAAALNVRCSSYDLRTHLVYGYMNFLEYPPFDGLCCGNVFSVSR